MKKPPKVVTLMHSVDIVAGANALGSDHVRGELRIQVAGAKVAKTIKAIYRTADEAAYRFMTGEEPR